MWQDLCYTQKVDIQSTWSIDQNTSESIDQGYLFFQYSSKQGYNHQKYLQKNWDPDIGFCLD